ncbi:MAG: thioredoxin-like domain-containing protein [Planctomycetota bacterium]
MLTILVLALLLQISEPNDDSPNPPAEPVEVEVGELIDRPDLLPREVTARKQFRFGGGDDIAEGATLRVVGLNAEGLTVDTGRFLFVCKPEETDLLERAGIYIATLTPEQRALTLDAALRDSTLWPTAVALASGMEFSNGARIEPGTELPLRAVQGSELELYSASVGTILTVAATDTDFVRRGRELLHGDEADRRPHFVRSVESTLSTDAPSDLADADYILLYRGSGDCSRCGRFSPKLKRAYGKLKDRYGNFEVVFLSEDRSPAAFERHMRERDYPFAIVEYDKLYAAADARTREGRLMPIVYLVRPDGSVIDRTHPDGRGRSAEDVLKTLEESLSSRN